jgi:phosphoadenosine phosphosulfate reductase
MIQAPEHEFTPEHAEFLSTELAHAHPHEVIQFAQELFEDEVTLACSFQDLVLLDIAAKAAPGLRVFTVDTGFLFYETEATMRRAMQRYPQLRFEVFRPRIDITTQADQHGRALYSREPELCCAIRKVEPTQRALAGYKAWITGIRRDQSATRASIQPVAWDLRHNMIKFAPLYAWTSDDVWTYARMHDVPYNPLHDRGYPSIGCAPCTSIPANGDIRSGRWAGTAKSECGIHSEAAAVQDALNIAHATPRPG